MKIGCVIMAAGTSQRFGGDKLLAPLAGRPLLAHVLEACPRERFAKIVAVARSEAVAGLCAGHDLRCLTYAGGPQSETVRLGIAEMADMDGCLFLLGDQPLCTRRSIERLTEAFCRGPDRVYRLAFMGEPGSPVLFPRALFTRLSGLTGDRGGMAALPGAAAEVCLVEAESAGELLDVDTREALARAEIHLIQGTRQGP